MKNIKYKQPIFIYLFIVFGICFGLFIVELIANNGRFYNFLGVAFTFIPVLSAMITRKITKVQSKYHLSLKVWRNPKVWLFSAFVPSLLIVLGVVLYFIIFNDEYSGVLKYGLRFGTDKEIIVNNPILLALSCIVIAALMFPIQLLELGEEIGWRGFLLGFQAEKYGEKKAVLINGIEWGISHLPLIYFGFNYSLQNPGAPWTNMIMMIVVCVILGTIFSYVTIKTGNCMFAAIIHGTVNIIGELPVYLTYDMKNGLLGPNPTGLISVSFLFILSFVIFTKKLKTKLE